MYIIILFFRLFFIFSYFIIVMGDMMKKTILWILVALISGGLLGKYTFDKYEDVEVKNVISINNDVYMIKYGTYLTQNHGNTERRKNQSVARGHPQEMVQPGCGHPRPQASAQSRNRGGRQAL